MSVKTTENKTSKFSYKRVEKHISMIGPKTYRIRVGKDSLYAPTRAKARDIKRTLLHK